MGQCPSLECIGALLEGRLSDDEKKQLLTHISMCPDCSTLYTTGVMHMGLQEHALVPKISESMQKRMVEQVKTLIKKRMVYMRLHWSEASITLFKTHEQLCVAERVQMSQPLFDTQNIENFNYPSCYFLVHQNGFNIYATDPAPMRLEVDGKKLINLEFNSGMFKVSKEMLGISEDESFELVTASGESETEVKLIFEIK